MMYILFEELTALVLVLVLVLLKIVSRSRFGQLSSFCVADKSLCVCFVNKHTYSHLSDSWRRGGSRRLDGDLDGTGRDWMGRGRDHGLILFFHPPAPVPAPQTIALQQHRLTGVGCLLRLLSGLPLQASSGAESGVPGSPLQYAAREG